MRRKLCCLLLALALAAPLLALPERASAEERLSFIAINDTLPPELVNCVTYYNGMIYVPWFTFTNYGFGISYTFLTTANTAYLYTRDKQLFFELSSGKCYDGDGNDFSSPGIMQGGTVYLPLSTVYWFFGGFSYSNIPGNEYGSILRLTTGSEVLSDADVLRGARNYMRNYYLSYNQALAAMTEPPVQTLPLQTPTPPAETPVPTESPAADHRGERFTLSFSGLPPAQLLDYLAKRGMQTTFFLSPEELRADPDLARRIAGDGHGLGIRCGAEDPAGDWAEGAELLFETARVPALLCAAGAGYETESAVREMAEAAELVYCPCAYNAEGTVFAANLRRWLETEGAVPSLRIGCGANGWPAIAGILQYLQEQQYEIVRPRETTG